VLAKSFGKNKEKKHNEERRSIGQIIVKLMKNPSYLFAVYAMTNLKFIVTGLQYWVPHYMKVVLNAEENLVFILVAVTVISATSFGALSGGAITTKFLGSYTNSRSATLCLLMLTILSLASLPLSYLESPYAFIACVWVVMFCHGFIEPIFTGILLTSVAPEEAATASSVLIFMQMVLGFLPAPYVYGLLVDEFPEIVGPEEDNVSRWGMRGITFYSVLGVVTLLISILIKSAMPNTSQSKGNEENLLVKHSHIKTEVSIVAVMQGENAIGNEK
jgi:MFS family permease